METVEMRRGTANVAQLFSMRHKRHPLWFVLALMALDMIAAAIGTGAAYGFRFFVFDVLVAPRGGHEPADYLKLIPAAMLAWFLALQALGMYSESRRVLDWRGVGRLFQAMLGATGLLLAWLFFARPSSSVRPEDTAPYSRVFMAIWMAFTVLSLALARWGADRLIGHLRRHRHWAMGRSMIVGAGTAARQIAKTLRKHPEYGRHVVGVVAPGIAEAGGRDAGAPVLGSTEELPELIHTHQIDEVIVAQNDIRGERLQSLLEQCEQGLVDFRLVPSWAEIAFSKMAVESIDGVPFLGLPETPLRGWNALAKRLFDIFASGVSLAALAIPMLLIARKIRRDSPGPALYRQERVGFDGREFVILKFRSMFNDAEEKTGPVMAAENDPRVTPYGRILRRRRIDEWPQLINVLKGEMSLVGPRPERPFFVRQFSQAIPRYMGRHRVKSGITGWAQVNGLCGPHGSIERRLQYDLRYIEEWSWWLDFTILWRTVATKSEVRSQKSEV